MYSLLLLQVLIAELMEHWGDDGLHKHLLGMQNKYKERATAMQQAAEQVWLCKQLQHTP